MKMAALLGYLFALAVFLSGGYLGLEWLASPDVVTHARSRDSSTSHRPEVALKKTAPNVAAAKDAAVGTQPDTAAVRRGKPGNETADAADATGDISKNQKPDGVPAGGCMPIGVTAKGQMVFPLQCRELIERQHRPTSPSASVELAAPAPALQDTGTRKTGTNDNIAASAPRRPELSTSAPVANKIAKENDNTHGPHRSNPETGQKDPEHVAAAPTNEIEPKDVVAPIPPKSNAQRVAVKPKRIEKMRPGQDRSKLVAMTLETLRFEDGHLERRLVPLKRSALQTDWYNPLGLR